MRTSVGEERIALTDVVDWTDGVQLRPAIALIGDGLETPTLFEVLGLAHIVRRAHLRGGALTDIAASAIAHRLAEHVIEVYRLGGPRPAACRRPGRAQGGRSRRAVRRRAPR